VSFDRDRTEELAVESRKLETPPSPPQRTSRTRQSSCSSCKLRLRRLTRISRTQETPTLSPLQNILKNVKKYHAESRKIAVKVYKVRDETEELDIRRTLKTTTLKTHIINIKKKQV
jgi:hypothetical protein